MLTTGSLSMGNTFYGYKGMTWSTKLVLMTAPDLPGVIIAWKSKGIQHVEYFSKTQITNFRYIPPMQRKTEFKVTARVRHLMDQKLIGAYVEKIRRMQEHLKQIL